MVPLSGLSRPVSNKKGVIELPETKTRTTGPESGTKAEDIFAGQEWKAPPRPKTASEYENKVNGILSTVMRGLASNPETVADAATLIDKGPAFARAVGDGAAKDQRIKDAIDFIESGAGNPYVAITMTGLPIALQFLRNHARPEGASKDAKPVRTVRVPFTKRTIKWRTNFSWKALRDTFRFKTILQNTTYPPELITEAVFSNAQVQKSLRSQGIQVAWNGNAKSNGSQPN